MSTRATGTFEAKSWDEQPYAAHDGAPKLTHAAIVNAFDGDIEGESTLEYLMVYPRDDAATFLGLERVVGRIGGRAGSLVLQHSGVYEDGGVQATWFVVADSGTGELRGLRGEGSYVWDGEGRTTKYTLDYTLE